MILTGQRGWPFRFDEGRSVLAQYLLVSTVKAGAEYEQFVYDKLRCLFPDAVVTLNDKILGRESNIEREIDVSIRIATCDIELLYIVQCKDWATRVDINTLGAFSAVMNDVGAAKGFLLCTSGFYQTNHQYALARGIELVTIEDMTSHKWKAEVQIPLVYVCHFNRFTMDLSIAANEALIELNRNRDVEIRLTTATPVRAAAGGILTTLENYVFDKVKDPRTVVQEGSMIDLTLPDLEIVVAEVWVPCSHLSLVMSSTRTFYLKYLTPTEYSQLRDHVRGTTVPLHCKIENVPLVLDKSFLETTAEAVSSFPGFWMEIEESNLIPRHWVRMEPLGECKVIVGSSAGSK